MFLLTISSDLLAQIVHSKVLPLSNKKGVAQANRPFPLLKQVIFLLQRCVYSKAYPFLSNEKLQHLPFGKLLTWIYLFAYFRDAIDFGSQNTSILSF